MGLITKLLDKGWKKRHRHRIIDWVKERHNVDFYFGTYVGSKMLEYIPNKSCDMLTGNLTIDVTKEESNTFEELSWMSAVGETDHEEFVRFSHELDRKYLPNPLDIVLPFFTYKNEKKFKKGIARELWDSDRCPYSTELDDIEIHPIRGRRRLIRLHLKLDE